MNELYKMLQIFNRFQGEDLKDIIEDVDSISLMIDMGLITANSEIYTLNCKYKIYFTLTSKGKLFLKSYPFMNNHDKC